MRRSTAIVANAVVVCILGGLSVGPVVGAREECTKGSVEGIAEGTAVFVTQFYRGQDMGTAGSWGDCQFRFYDDNDLGNREIPHVFSDADWFLGGIFRWLTYEQMEERGWNREDASAFLDSFVDHFYLREVGGQWTEYPVEEISHRGVNAVPIGEVLPIISHDYVIFSPGSLEPGSYQWKWVVLDPELGKYSVRAAIEIVDD